MATIHAVSAVSTRGHFPVCGPAARSTAKPRFAVRCAREADGGSLVRKAAPRGGLDRRTVAALLSAQLPLINFAQQGSGGAAFAATPPAESNCESCSNSNSALEPGDKAFVTSPSGLRVLDLRQGTGPQPSVGQTCVVDWVGYTAGYQAKKIESTRETDTPFVFTLGKGEAIPAFEEAIAGMKQGGLRRVEIPGELVETLGYSKVKEARYVAGPVPTTFAGRRALDFVLDNQTLRDFNRTLLFDIRLSSVRQ